ncbi:ABC transporter ATP-binding protein [Cumulibacter soli]|uniref:ABC transporter ATP-binding protein n=1 Tax=Cumulibacter soli TaxID=2546344 RepID=UPI001FBA9C68|nr:oligopeptide/dipeptide ABC transporter ATP-binding protein [Cumulibacter soli]
MSLDGVSVRFPVGRRKFVTAVDDVSVDIIAGETLGLIGESGSGKSTLARALTGLVPVSSGSVRWRGDDTASFSRAQRRTFTSSVQMIFQDPHSALDPRRTIGSSVREPLDVLNIGDKRRRSDVVMTALADVGLTESHAARYPHQLSGGQKQRANIARALVSEPEMLICDESVAALDVALQAEILNLLQDLKVERHLTIVFISHDLAVVGHVADRVNVMYVGKLVEQAPTDEIFERPRHPYSEALLSAQLDVTGTSRHRIILDGDIPSPMSPPSGCRFRTRCPHALELCAVDVPKLGEVAPAHASACLRTAALYGDDSSLVDGVVS